MKSAPQIVRRIIESFREPKTFCVVGHIRPDGDCIGSQLALALALRNEGKRVRCWNEDAVPQKLRFLDTEGLFEKPKAGEKFDCVIATDCASYERLGKVGQHIGTRKLFVNIDHHTSNTRYADINWVMGKEPSCGELIYRLIRAANWTITKPIADCLFTAVSTDTGSFQYPNTLPGTYHVAGDLVKRGADLARICDEVYQSYSLQRVRLLKHVYNSFRLTHDDQIAWFWLRQRDFTRTGAERNDTEGLIEHIRDIEPVVVACAFEELDANVVRISLRSKNGKVNVNEIAAQFGGGGHRAAAGARIAGSPASVQRRVLSAIKQAMARAE